MYLWSNSFCNDVSCLYSPFHRLKYNLKPKDLKMQAKRNVVGRSGVWLSERHGGTMRLGMLVAENRTTAKRSYPNVMKMVDSLKSRLKKTFYLRIHLVSNKKFNRWSDLKLTWSFFFVAAVVSFFPFSIRISVTKELVIVGAWLQMVNRFLARRSDIRNPIASAKVR